MNLYEYTIHGDETIEDKHLLISAKSVPDAETIGNHIFNKNGKPYSISNASYYTKYMCEEEGYYTSISTKSFVAITVRSIKIDNLRI